MVKPVDRAYSRKALEAIIEVGRQIKIGRAEREMTAKELAERAGLSRALLHRIEHGDPGCSIGAVFEAAAIVGALSLGGTEASQTLTTLDDKRAMGVRSIGPVRRRRATVQDDF